MIEIMDQIKQTLVTAGLTVYLIEVPTAATYPYVLLWFSPGQPAVESSIVGSADLSDLIGATMVDTTPRNAMTLTKKVRDAIAGTHFTAGAFLAWLTLSASQTVRDDKDLILPDTNEPPYYAVDRYQLTATPA